MSHKGVRSLTGNIQPVGSGSRGPCSRGTAAHGAVFTKRPCVKENGRHAKRSVTHRLLEPTPRRSGSRTNATEGDTGLGEPRQPAGSSPGSRQGCPEHNLNGLRFRCEMETELTLAVSAVCLPRLTSEHCRDGSSVSAPRREAPASALCAFRVSHSHHSSVMSLLGMMAAAHEAVPLGLLHTCACCRGGLPGCD